MDGITEKAKIVLAESKTRNKSKLEKQVKYYNKLTTKGVAKAQSYALGTVSVV